MVDLYLWHVNHCLNTFSVCYIFKYLLRDSAFKMQLNFHVLGSWIRCPFACPRTIFIKCIHVKTTQKYTFFVHIASNNVCDTHVPNMLSIQASLICLKFLHPSSTIKSHIIAQLQHFRYTYNDPPPPKYF